MQHDSHEFMMYLLGSLQDEETPMEGSNFDGSDERKSYEQILSEYDRSHPSIIDKLFSGMQRTIVTCGKCQRDSVTYNPFMTLSLTFESSIEKSLSGFLKAESLSDKYKCEKCNKSSAATIKHELCRLPEVIVLHLKRFTFPSMKKIKGKSQYYPYIDMKK